MSSIQQVVEAVQASADAAGKSRPRMGGFSLSRAGTSEGFFAAALGVYLGYAVVRMHEVFPVLFVPRLPMILTILFALGLGIAIPGRAWGTIWKASRAVRLVAFITALAIVTTFLGIYISGSVDFLVNRFFITVTVFLSCAVFLRDRRWLRLAMSIYILAAGAVTAKSLFFPTFQPLTDQELDQQEWENQNRAERGLEPKVERLKVGLSLDPNDFGSILVTAIPIALWLGQGSVRRRVFWGAIAILFVAGIVPTASRGALIGLFATGIALILQGESGRKRIFLVLLASAAAAVFVFTVGSLQSERFLDFSGTDYNVTENEGRLSFWRQGMIWMLKRPTGLGIGNYPVYFGIINGPERAAHNSFVQYGAELGVAGLVSFTLLWHTLFKGTNAQRRRALSLRKTQPGIGTDEAALNGYIFAALVGTVVTGFFLSNGYQPLLYMPLGLATAVLLGSPLPVAAPVPEPSGKRSAPARGPGWRAQRSAPVPGASARGRTPPMPPTQIVGS